MRNAGRPWQYVAVAVGGVVVAVAVAIAAAPAPAAAASGVVFVLVVLVVLVVVIGMIFQNTNPQSLCALPLAIGLGRWKFWMQYYVLYIYMTMY